MSVSYDIKVAAQGVLQALSPPLPAAVVVRKLPGFDEALETLPLVIVCNSEKPEENVPAGFATFNVTYNVDFAIVHASNHDRVTGLALEDDVRQRIRKAFDRPTLAGAPSVWNTRFIATPPYDRAKYAVNYDYSFVTIAFDSQEP